MICTLCTQMLQDIREGNVAKLKPPGWEVGGAEEPGEGEKRNVNRMLRLDSIPCRFKHCQTLDGLRKSGNNCELCKYLSMFAEYRNFFRDPVQTKGSDVVTMGLYGDESFEAKQYDNIGKFLFHVGEGWKPRPLHMQIYEPIAEPSCLVEYIKDEKGVARAKESYTALSLGRPILQLDSEEDFDSLMALVQVWLNDCKQNHLLCRDDSNFIPTRVIDVGSLDDSRQPRLYVTSEKDRCTPYLTLSYCWGEQTQENTNLVTTESTFNERQISIPMDELPLCCRDAVKITRKLGFRFIWIDAICIIQEQEMKEDWIKESAQMAQIYANSILTISAGSSDRCNNRILQPRYGSDVGLQIQVKGNLSNETIGIREFPTALNQALRETEICKRGWTMQERALSSRILHFTPHQIFWQCTTTEHSEDGRNKEEMWGQNDHRLYLREELDPVELRQAWYRIVDEHKDLALTNPGDRLPALAGIAKAYHRQFKCKYLAGLWECHLPENLLWISNDIGPVIDHGKGKVPSWSWINAPGSIMHSHKTGYYDDSEILVTVEYATVEANNVDNEFLGYIRDAKIGLRGIIKKVKCLVPSFGKSDLREVDDADDQEYKDYNWQDSINFDRERDELQICWGLVISRHGDNDGSGAFEILLLEEVDAMHAIFKRVGTATLSPVKYRKLFRGASEKSIQLI
ncbi:heterokaryon incompatibility protein-domain-containing protein [Halenospora varia]|nr:heterokaryon incompatibility protein-domain-containing protein [Halenospora varia]